MDYIEQMLAELGDGAELTTRVDDKVMRGYIREQIGDTSFRYSPKLAAKMLDNPYLLLYNNK